MKTPIERFFTGFLAPVEGARALVSDKKTLALSILPTGLGLFFGLVMLVTVIGSLEPISGYLLGLVPSLGGIPILSALVAFITMLILFIFGALINTLLAYLLVIVLAGPFYSLMVEHMFKQAGVLKEDHNNLRLMLRMFLLGLMKVLLFGFIALACLIMSFMPGLNILAAFLVFLVIAFDCTDFAFEVDFLGLGERIRFLFRYLPEFSGLAGAVFLTSFVPGLLFFVLPIFICGATKMYIQLSAKSV